MNPEIKILQKKYNLTSNVYDILDFPFEYLRYRRLREVIWKRAKGKILDAGVGTGKNIIYYPEKGEVISIDLSMGMLDKSKKLACKKNIHVDLLQMDILNLSFSDKCFDTIIATFIFCVIPDSLQVSALRELKRVCKKDGEIILLEYTFSNQLLRRLWMKIMSPYVNWLYGAGFDRKTKEHIRSENLKIIEETFVVKDVIKLIRLKI